MYLQTYLSIIANDQNIVLIGLPGAGKRYIGEQLSDKLGIFMLDVDRQIEKKKNTKVFNLLIKRNEKYFRDLETKTIKELSSRTGKIITTGSGIVLRERNIKALERNSIIVYIDRDIKKIKKTLNSQESKLLLEKYGSLESMYSERDHLYRKYADITVENRGNSGKVADKIIDLIMGKPVED